MGFERRTMGDVSKSNVVLQNRYIARKSDLSANDIGPAERALFQRGGKLGICEVSDRDATQGPGTIKALFFCDGQHKAEET